MDFTIHLPLEIWEKIFSLLTGEDLWNVLAVSKRWRSIANSDLLWKKQCLKEDVELDGPLRGDSADSELCTYAKRWGSWRWGLVYNWERNRYAEFEMQTKSFDNFRISSYKDKIAFSDGSNVTVCTRRNSEMVSLLKQTFGMSKVRDIAINSDFLVVLLQTFVLVCPTSDFKSYHVLTFDNSRLRIFKGTSDNPPAVPFESPSVEFVFLNGDSLWLSPYLFLKKAVIVDLPTASFTNINFDWKCTLLRANENVIARSDSKLAVYSLNGEKCFEMTCLDYSWINTSKSVLALITDDNISTYDRLSGKRLGCIRKSFFEFHIHYKRDIIYGLSKTQQKLRKNVEALSLVSGDLLWSVQVPGTYSSEIKPVLSRFLFYCITESNCWYILDAKTGKCLSKNTMINPGKILYVTDWFWVCETQKKLIFRFY